MTATSTDRAAELRREIRARECLLARVIHNGRWADAGRVDRELSRLRLELATIEPEGHGHVNP